MIKIDLVDEQRNKINNLMCEYLSKHNIFAQIEELTQLLERENCNKTAKKLKEEIKNNELFLLKDKESLSTTIKIFDEAIVIDSKLNKNIIKLIKYGQKEIKSNGTITTERIYGFFDFYKSFSDSEQAYHILDILEVNVCPYCNRQYTFTVRKKDKNNYNKSRPQFDHFFPKGKYPYLSISIFNLVPSCALCNQGKSNTSPEKFLYPYEESFENEGLYFEISNVVSNLMTHEQIRLEIEPRENHEKLIEQYNNSFKIKLLYNKHSNYISELLYKNYVFNDDAIESIYNSYRGLFNSQSELKHLILGNCEPDNFNKRPLSKLTYDIMRQINCK